MTRILGRIQNDLLRPRYLVSVDQRLLVFPRTAFSVRSVSGMATEEVIRYTDVLPLLQHTAEDMLLLVLLALSQNPSLESQLQAESPAALAKAAREFGDAKRGAIVFFSHTWHVRSATSAMIRSTR